MIQILTIICQMLTVCALALTVYWQRKADQQLKEAAKTRAKITVHHHR
ncbi:hypothetical protein [Kocuria sp.]|nr:hypothetical protein [Kocuria sp.]MDO4919928.1 hypothetical protein [Kocuria sp.]